MTKILEKIKDLEFDRHPIAGNPIAFITLLDGQQIEAFRQAGLSIWAFRGRSEMSQRERRELDDFLEIEFKKQNEEGL